MSVSPATMVTHLTFHKCGSQWVRDVLTAPEVARHTGIRLDGRSPNLFNEEWPVQEQHTFLGPLYNAAREDWKQHRQTGQKAVVVLRDPRDRLVSWMFSFAYSHEPNPAVRLIRDPLLALDLRNRVLLGMFEFSRLHRIFRSWAGQPPDGAFVTSYEKIVADQQGEFRRMLDFLGLEVPDTALAKAVERLSFAKRSGRERGQENIHSHYRKGLPGDWRNFFDRDLGQTWENRFPGLLTTLGYEADGQWWEMLPQDLPAVAGTSAPDNARLHELEAALTRLKEQNDELRRANDELLRALEKSRLAAAG